VSDVEIWGVVLQEGHWNHGGWTVDSRDGLLVCACKTVLREAVKVAAS